MITKHVWEQLEYSNVRLSVQEILSKQTFAFGPSHYSVKKRNIVIDNLQRYNSIILLNITSSFFARIISSVASPFIATLDIQHISSDWP